MDYSNLVKTDSEIAEAVRNELARQEYGLELIASENFVHPAVLETAGSVLTNKYAEGYPHKRYYGGNEFVDIAEDLAIARGKELFNAEHVNVQPHCGSSANMAAYYALIKPGEKIMGMSLAHGGHLTHGFRVSFSGNYYSSCSYGVSEETHLLDYDAIRKIAIEEKPQIIVSGASAYPRSIDFKAFQEIAQEVGAYCMSDIAHIAGLVSAKLHNDPIPYCDVVTTTTHKTLCGPRGGMVMSKQEHGAAIDKAVFPALQGGPLEHIIAAKAVAFKLALQDDFKQKQKQTILNAQTLASELMQNGLDIISGGTDNHLMLVDVTKIGSTGKKAQNVLEEVGITVNMNMIPFDKRKPFSPSGIRIGTPALTTRGMKESEMKQISEFIVRTLKNADDEEVKGKVKEEVVELCKQFPLYPNIKI